MNRFLFFGIYVWLGFVSFQQARGVEKTVVGNWVSADELQKPVRLFEVATTGYVAATNLYEYSIMTNNDVWNGPLAGEKVYTEFPLGYLSGVQTVAGEVNPKHSAMELVLPLLMEAYAGVGESSLLLRTADGVWSAFSFRGQKIQEDARFYFPQELHDILACLQLLQITQFFYLQDTGEYAHFLRSPWGERTGTEWIPLNQLLLPLQVQAGPYAIDPESGVAAPLSPIPNEEQDLNSLFMASEA